MSYSVGDSDRRPWGSWEVLGVGPSHAVKRIVVDPGQVLSYQYHHHRAEHWVIVSGVAEITLDDAVFERHPSESVFIPQGAKHRIANRGTEPVVFVEVQTGETLDEDDIVRLDDRYGRAG